MRTVCELNKCSGCMACVDMCARNAIKIQDTYTDYNAVIDESICVNCGACQSVCQVNHIPKLLTPKTWYQGWVKKDTERIRSSSGGAAMGIAKSFVENGGIVYSCVFKDGEFLFEAARDKEDIFKFSGSKYVKSNPRNLYKQVRTNLKAGKKVLVIGLPCQIGALKNFIKGNLQKSLYTVDLICHGTPSPRTLEVFLNQYGKSLKRLENIQFRVKAKMQVHGDYAGIVTKGVSDKYSIAFLNSLIYTDNCYQCQYAQFNRVSDITLGDSWGSDLPSDEKKKGVSLILCQTEKGKELLSMSEMQLMPVDIDNAIQHNHQLKEPSTEPNIREKFFEKLYNGKSFNSLVFKAFPKACVKQNIKSLLIHMKILGGGLKRTLDYGIQIREKK